MKRPLLILLALALWGPGPARALGQEEDPNQILTKTFNLAEVRTLEVRGEIHFTLAQGPKAKVTVETTRALFDQLNVSDWWGSAAVTIESGLRGPREMGTVKATIEVPDLAELTVADRSWGTGTWPGTSGSQPARIRVYDESTLDLAVETPSLEAETSWLSSLVLKGKTGLLDARLRHQSRMVTRDLETGETRVFLDEASTFEAGTTGKGSGTARHGSRVTLPAGAPWETLELREGSVRDDRPLF